MRFLPRASPVVQGPAPFQAPQPSPDGLAPELADMSSSGWHSPDVIYNRTAPALTRFQPGLAGGSATGPGKGRSLHNLQSAPGSPRCPLSTMATPLRASGHPGTCLGRGPGVHCPLNHCPPSPSGLLGAAPNSSLSLGLHRSPPPNCPPRGRLPGQQQDSEDPVGQDSQARCWLSRGHWEGHRGGRVLRPPAAH